jgi:hypothetical protein
LVEGKYERTGYDRAQFVDKQQEQAKIATVIDPDQSSWSHATKEVYSLLKAEEEDVNFETQEKIFLATDFSRNPNLLVRKRNSQIILECSLRHKKPLVQVSKVDEELR